MDGEKKRKKIMMTTPISRDARDRISDAKNSMESWTTSSYVSYVHNG